MTIAMRLASVTPSGPIIAIYIHEMGRIEALPKGVALMTLFVGVETVLWHDNR
jgi:hypothetical protein